ncbi:MAG TPA: DsbA family oxidoreductase [Alphaproteobacteria bacterium]|jgi:predicted DsbA family dithiol-disulfide isomerase|nr:DsbA family oxidoreductase [Alphaproteobacteria bacterium]
MKIDVISDTVCPWCFIGKRRLEAALVGFDGELPEVVWHPFQLNPDLPVEGMPRSQYLELKFGGPARAERVYRSVAEAASAEALPFALDRIGRTPNTMASHRLIHFAGHHGYQNSVVEALFRAYFFDGRDIGQVETLAAIAFECGLDRDEALAYLQSDEGAVEVAQRDRHARSIGVNGVPCFIIDGRYAVSGAQDPEVFQQVFAVAIQEFVQAAEAAE